MYFYTAAFVSLMMATNGVMVIGFDLLDKLFDGNSISNSSTRLAWGLALVIIGIPLWAFHWRAITRHVADLPVETRSEIRKIYLYLVMGVSGALVLTGALGVLEQIFRAGDFSGFPWAAVVVWSTVWSFHWWLENNEGQETPETLGIKRFYLYLASLATLTMFVVGAGRSMHILLNEGYVSAFSVPELILSESSVWSLALQSSLAMMLVGGVGWATHWLVLARRDSESALRWAYLYVFPILGGIITSLIAIAWLIHGVLTWALGALGNESVVEHFDFLPGVVASVAVGVGLWAYHWWKAQNEVARSPHLKLGANRAYDYIIAILGLGTLSVASFFILNTALSVFTERSRALITGQDLWKEPVALAITLILIGAPVWGYAWRSIQRRVSGEVELGERKALSRKIFTFVVLGAGVLALVISASASLFVFLRDLLDVGLDLDTIRDIRPAIGVALTAAFILPYQWSVYRSDRLAEPDEERETRTRKQVSVLAQDGSQEFVRAIEDVLGYSIEVLRWVDAEAVMPTLTQETLLDLADRVTDTTGASVLVVPDGAGVRVLSYN
jgi:hypothetical protein